MNTTAVVAIIAVALLISAAFFKSSLKLLCKVLLSTAAGFLALALLNHFGAKLGVTITVNWAQALIVGILGLPGLALVLLLQWVT
ncbi:MAG: pro-sigmaK processing inhibitor BofA family protein [Oscillospiraceae bacterium]|jgi:inhibitor of the pro-sigma K processing machinery|nr:pro-sigmaK processing inhibitor BofA family protein [Oscillospiraceae bacterium]